METFLIFKPVRSIPRRKQNDNPPAHHRRNSKREHYDCDRRHEIRVRAISFSGASASHRRKMFLLLDKQGNRRLHPRRVNLAFGVCPSPLGYKVGSGTLKKTVERQRVNVLEQGNRNKVLNIPQPDRQLSVGADWRNATNPCKEISKHIR
ncbi:MAG: hypothetical protein ACREH8_07260 [Opitutaceae bacterium]